MNLSVKAKDLKPGDRTVRGTVARVSTQVTAEDGDVCTYVPDATLDIERPEETVTITIPRSTAESWATAAVYAKSTIAEACHKALYHGSRRISR
jgi:hypothetical protein